MALELLIYLSISSALSESASLSYQNTRLTLSSSLNNLHIAKFVPNTYYPQRLRSTGRLWNRATISRILY